MKSLFVITCIIALIAARTQLRNQKVVNAAVGDDEPAWKERCKGRETADDGTGDGSDDGDAGDAGDAGDVVVGPETDEEFCGRMCLAEGFCCNDPTIGSNQFVSCSQACMMRARGTEEGACAEICERERGCSMKENGHDYRFCSSCADLEDHCPHGVQGRDECHKGCTMEP